MRAAQDPPVEKHVVLVVVISAFGLQLDGGPRKTIEVTVLAARLALLAARLPRLLDHSRKFHHARRPDGSFRFPIQQNEWPSVTAGNRLP